MTFTAYAAGEYVYLGSSAVNIRETPSTGAGVAGQVTTGQLVAILSKKSAENDGYMWQPVNVGSTLGYCATSIMRLDKVEIPDQADLRLAVAAGMGSAVNVRAAPTMDAAVIGSLSTKGAVLKLGQTVISGGWRQMVMNGLLGYVSAPDIDFEWFRPIQLDIPFATQQDNSVHNDCGAASVRMLALFYHGSAPSIEAIAAATGTTNKLTTATDLVNMGHYCSLSLETSYQLSLVVHYRSLIQYMPAIPLVDYGCFAPQPYAYDGGHWLVTTGMDATHMILNDPLQYSPNWRAPLDQFTQSLNSYLVS